MIHDSCPICGNDESFAVLSREDRRIMATRDQPFLCEATGQRDLTTAHHEAGHVIAARAFAAGVHYVTICDHPHAAIDPTGQGTAYLSRLVISAAGDVAAAVCAGEQFLPLWRDLRRCVARARESKPGSCDRCIEARVLVSAAPQLSDLEVVDAWYGILEVTTDLFETASWRGALEALAAELNDKTLLEWEAIGQLLEPYDLGGAREEVLSNYKV